MKQTANLVAVLVTLSGHTTADLVPGGDFQMYKPGTGYTITAAFADGGSFARGVGDGITLALGTVNYSDATSGTTVDLPGWTGPVNDTATNDLVANGLDGGTGLNVFGTWSSGNGNMVASSSPLTRPPLGFGEIYEISVMVNGSAGPLTLDLLVDGAVITPTGEVTPTLPTSGWEKMSRTYATLPAGDVTILLGTPRLGGDLFGARTVLDDVRFDAVDSGLAPALRMTITPNAVNPGNYDFEWESRDGKLYDLVSSTDLSSPISAWPVWDGRMDIAGTAPMNVLTNVPGGGDTRRFFAAVEKPLLAETFDATASVPAEWSADDNGAGTAWQVGDPGSGPAFGPDAAASGTNCAGTNIVANYSDNALATLTTPALAIPAAGATLSFKQYIDTDTSGDVGAVRLLDADDADAEIVDGVFPVTSIGGIEAGWTAESFAFPAAAVGKNVKVRFEFVSDGDGEFYTGFYIDDVTVEGN